MDITSATVSFSSRGQIVIPRRVREHFGIEEGTRVVIESGGDAIILKPITRASVRKQFGKYCGHNLLKALGDEKKAEKNR